MPGQDQGNNINNNTCAYTFDFFKNQIDKSIIDYIASLPDGSDPHNTNTFNGMIMYAGDTAFHGVKTCDLDIDLLDGIFKYYASICSIYNKHPFILQFCIFINIDHSTYNRWINGAEKANTHRMQICQKWHDVCEHSQVADTTVKSMFLLKSKYGYVEATAPVVITHEIRQETPDLLAKYKDYPTITG